MRRALIWLTTRRLAMVILFVAIFAMAVRPPADTDTWWHLAAGRVTAESGHILQADLFSHTRYGARWVNHSWLSQVLLYGLFDVFSYVGLGVWIGVVVTAAFAFVYLQMEGGVFTRAFILVLAAATSAVIWSARPQLFSFLLTAVVGWVLYQYKWRGRNRLWLLPLLFVLWVNLHAGYALGFIVIVGFVAGEVLNHLLVQFAPADDPAPVVGWRGLGLVVGVTLLSALLLVINPNGPRMWTYYLETVRIGALQDFIQEWQSPDFHPLHAQPFIWLLLATMAAMGLSERRVDGVDLALVGGMAYAALLAWRNVGPFALVAAPALSRHVTSLLSARHSSARRRPSVQRALLNWGVVLVIVVATAFRVYLPLRPGSDEALQREGLPVDAVEWLQGRRPAGQLFNHYNWGGYLIWRLWPEQLVFVDGRTDLYGDGFLRRYAAVQAARPGFEEVLEAHEVELVMMPAEGPLAAQLASRAAWEAVYRGDVATVWERGED
jgi:hypothetical protein